MRTAARRLRAIDVRQIPMDALSWDQVREGVAPEDLPCRSVKEPRSWSREAAVLSWRWDRDARTGRSRNIALALKHAKERGLRYVFLDAVSVDQTQPRERLLRDVFALADLFSSIPVIAAYEEREDGRSREETEHRPWILYEIRSYCRSRIRVDYVGHRPHGTGDDPKALDFANEVSQIRDQGYADTVLDVLHGRVGMTDVADFSLILGDFGEAIAACHVAFSRNDFLMALFVILCGYESRQFVEGYGGERLDYGHRLEVADPRFDGSGLERFTLGPARDDVRHYETARAVLLDGHEVGIWRSKMTTSFDRNWFAVLPGGEDHIFDVVGVSPAARSAFRDSIQSRQAVIYIDRDAPRPKIHEHLAELDVGRWVKPPQRPVSIGFRPDLWR